MFRTDVWTLDTRKSPNTRAFETNADRLGPGETVTLTVLWSSGLDTPSLESVVFQRISPVTQEPTGLPYAERWNA